MSVSVIMLTSCHDMSKAPSHLWMRLEAVVNAESTACVHRSQWTVSGTVGHITSTVHCPRCFCQATTVSHERSSELAQICVKGSTDKRRLRLSSQKDWKKKERTKTKTLHKCVYADPFQKPHTHGHTQKTKKQALDNTIAFPTMVSESVKLESTMMHTAHNDLTNCSFCLKIHLFSSVSAITPPGRHTVTDYM